VLKEGSQGGQVAALQTLCGLFKWGDVGRADGKFGPKTKAGVIAMQTALGTKPDGEYGPKSATALGTFLASAKG
jgi:peptidoglycan hydrolase-like protein with peptidoglycan-binding domain